MVLIQYILVFVQYISSTAWRSNFANCSCSSVGYGTYALRVFVRSGNGVCTPCSIFCQLQGGQTLQTAQN